MGPPGFYQWIKKCGYEPLHPYVSVKYTLLIDAKAAMYRFGYSVPITSQKFHQEIADMFIIRYAHFAQVTFINDGKTDDQHPKFQTNCKRATQRKTQRDVVETSSKRLKITDDEFVQLNEEQANQWEKEVEKVDAMARAARGISYDDSVKIMQLLEALPNFRCIQMDQQEADFTLIQMAPQFDFVVSEDADLLCGGVTNLLREFGTPKQAVYNINNILACLKISLSQLQQVVCMSGTDYLEAKIKGMGLKNAYDMIRKYKTAENMLIAFTKNPYEGEKFVIPDQFLTHLYKACELYNPKVSLTEKEEEIKKDVEL